MRFLVKKCNKPKQKTGFDASLHALGKTYHFPAQSIAFACLWCCCVRIRGYAVLDPMRQDSLRAERQSLLEEWRKEKDATSSTVGVACEVAHQAAKEWVSSVGFWRYCCPHDAITVAGSLMSRTPMCNKTYLQLNGRVLGLAIEDCEARFNYQNCTMKPKDNHHKSNH